MFNIFQSNRLEALVTILSKQLADNNHQAVLTPETVLVQSPGMAQWLKLEIAKQNGIAANMSFPLPSSFIWRLYQNLLPNIPEQSPFNKDKLTWVLFELLPDYLSLPEFVTLKQYLVSEGDAPEPKSNLHTKSFNPEQIKQILAQYRRFQLAEKIADVYDNYLMYRPHWLDHWQGGANDLPPQDLLGASTFAEKLTSQHWQAILWRAVVDKVEQRYAHFSPLPALHRAAMQRALLAVLAENASDQIRNLIGQRISIFGISTMAEQQLEVFEALGQHVDVDFYWFNPCSFYWGDVISPKLKSRLTTKQLDVLAANTDDIDQYYIVGNPLLASWGKVGKDFLDMVSQRNINIYDAFIEHVPDSIQDSAETKVLQLIQQDILNLEFRGSQLPLSPATLQTDAGKRCWSATDRSVQVHQCHSRLRELEVLKESLLSMLAEDPTLLPSDILVMMPDVNSYSPFIDGVFGVDQHQGGYLPFTVADRQNKDLSPSLTAFVDLLALPSSRFTLTEILDLIEVPFVIHKFEFDADDLYLIRNWVSASQIKWGINAEHKSRWQLPQRDLNTWSNGLQQMLLGIAMDDTTLWQDVVALPNIEGMQAKTLGKLMQFFTFFVNLQEDLAVEQSLPDWQNKVTELITACFDNEILDEVEQNVLMVLREANAELVFIHQELGVSSRIGHKIIHRYFAEQLSHDGVTQRFLAGKLNFCSLMPMRSVPFKVVCVLGLNEGEFPRNVDPISFDLVSQLPPKKGDRNRKLDERYLLLEALCSARDVFYLSYIGFSAKTNEVLPPSVLLSEFDEYLQQSFIAENGDELTTRYEFQHRLQPFDQAYYLTSQHSNLPRSYNPVWFNVAKNKAMAIKASEVAASRWQSSPQLAAWLSGYEDAELVTEFQPVMDFWKDPIKAFYRHQLEVKFELYTDELDEVENFQHDGLTKYRFVEQIVTEKLLQQPLPRSQWLRSGVFPAAQWGDAMFNDYDELTEHYIKVLASALATDRDQLSALSHTNHEYTCPHSQAVLQFKATELNQHLVLLRAGEVRPVDVVAGWLSHILNNASGRKMPTLVFGVKSGNPKWHGFPPLSAELCQTLLAQWLRLYGSLVKEETPLHWHLATAFAYQSAKLAGKHENELIDILVNALDSDHEKGYVANDEYSRNIFRQPADFNAEFMAVSELLLTPMLTVGFSSGARDLKKYLAHMKAETSDLERDIQQFLGEVGMNRQMDKEVADE